MIDAMLYAYMYASVCVSIDAILNMPSISSRYKTQ